MACIFRCFLKVPVIGTLVYITNSYVFAGDALAANTPAPWYRWFRVLLIPLAFASGLGALSSWVSIAHYFEYRSVFWDGVVKFGVSPGELIHAVMPSLLGFGIGVYALLFALNARFVADFQHLITRALEDGRRRHGSVMMLSAEMAYPLIVLVLVIGVGAIDRAIPQKPVLHYIAWSGFWYGLIVCVQLIGVLFGLGNQAVLDKLAEVKPQDNQ